jgi:hypothetical protein
LPYEDRSRIEEGRFGGKIASELGAGEPDRRSRGPLGWLRISGRSKHGRE